MYPFVDNPEVSLETLIAIHIVMQVWLRLAPVLMALLFAVLGIALGASYVYHHRQSLIVPLQTNLLKPTSLHTVDCEST